MDHDLEITPAAAMPSAGSPTALTPTASPPSSSGRSSTHPISPAGRAIDSSPPPPHASPVPAAEADVPDNKFAFSPDRLTRLLNARNAASLRAIGGLRGLCAGLRTDPKAGVSIDETELEGIVTLDAALRAARTGSPPELAALPPPIRRRTTMTRRTPLPFSDRRRIFGENRLPKLKQTSLLALMWHAFNDKLMFLLAASAVVSLALGISQVAIWGNGNTGSKTGWIEAATIIGAILLTVIATAANDYQKNYKFQKLNQRREERWLTVIRSGRVCSVSIFDIVVGDLVRVEAGDVLATDGVLVESFKLRCDESHISGESDILRKIPADEYVSDSNADPFMFSGAVVSQGIGTYVVTAVGTNSTSGRIALSLRNEAEQTPLQERLGHLAKYIIVLGSVVGALYFLALFIRWLVDLTDPGSPNTPRQKGEAFLSIFMLAVTVVIIGVPEGLSLAVAVALAFAATRMLRDNNLVRLLRSCEVMGGATTICSDKTGTLTCNEMSVVSGVIGCEENFGPNTSTSAQCIDDSDGESIATFVSAGTLVGELAHDVKALLKDSIVLNSTATEQDESGTGGFVGSSTETALLRFAREHFGLGPVAEERANAQVMDLFPFNADRKYMAVIIKFGDRYRLLAKGAAEIIVNNCVETLDNTKRNFNPHEELITTELTPEKRELLATSTRGYARRLLRPIALAYRDLDSWPPIAALGARDDPNDSYANFEQIFRHQMTLAAVFAIRDPLRPEVINSIRQCQHAGVLVRMLTGDNLTTAEATALESGIYTPGGVAMDGPTFRRLNQEQIDAIVPRLQVLARSNADDKAKLVMCLKRLGETVAVTGDGTNDAISLKAADVGFAMGKSGTEVAKEASSIVLMDDNFASIVKAIAWGRTVTESVKKYCQFQFTLNVTAAIITIVSTLVGDVNAAVFEVIQLLWLNLVMDILTGLLFSTDFPRPYLMRRRPEPRNTPLISVTMWKMILGQSIYQLAVVFALNYAGQSHFWPSASTEQAQTVVFNAYMFIQLFNQINCRRVDNGLDVFEGILDNPWFLGVQLVTFAGQIVIVFKGGDAFKTEPLSGAQWGWSILFGILVIPIGAAIRCVPDWWVLVIGNTLKPLAWPFIAFVRWNRNRRAQQEKRKETSRQKRAETAVAEEVGDIEAEAARRDQHARRHDWMKRILGSQSRANATAKRSADVPLTAVATKREPLMTGSTSEIDSVDGDRTPLDLFAAVEAAKYNTEGALPGLRVHPDTKKEDPVLLIPRTAAEVLSGASRQESRLVPPSQNWEIMRHMRIERRRQRRSSIND